jgi:hypothetical protein
MTGAECDLGNSTLPSTIASAKIEMGRRAKAAFNKQTRANASPFKLAVVAPHGNCLSILAKFLIAKATHNN